MCGWQTNGSSCAANVCCSQYGFCGITASYCGDGCQNGPCDPVQIHTSHLSAGVYAGIAVAAVAAVIAVALVILFMLHRRRLNKRTGDIMAHVKPDLAPDVEAKPLQIFRAQDSQSVGIPANLYRQSSNLSLGSSMSFDTLNLATNGFSEELGRGGFGVVYKGTLKDGTEIAVKKLLANEKGLKDFEAEVKTLGNINHANLVALLGYCYEQKQPFLIYEYVSNGSLDRWIFDTTKANPGKPVLPWKTRVDIAKGTAKGLAYLHEDLQVGQAIIHLDIKPENILLNENFVPKVADFGMAKLLGTKTTETIATGGTIGYMAPELYVGSASTRMDVYSFGIVLLEVLSGRKQLDRSRPRDEMYLPSWAMRKVIDGEGVYDVIDPLLDERGDIDWVVARRLILIGLLCLQRDPDERPPMSNVLRMIEGTTILPQLPRTLKPDLEMTERLVCTELATTLPAADSTSLIQFSSSTDSGDEGGRHISARGGANESSQRPLLFRPSVLGAVGFDPHFLSMTKEESLSDMSAEKR
ncbi:unnamed protein product [Calypogeia fissa]